MHLLQELGVVQQFNFGDGIARFELVGEGCGGHHHHLVCTGCARVVEIEECFAEDIEKRLAARNRFKAVTHKLEFFGLCPQCQYNPANSSSCQRSSFEGRASRRRARAHLGQTPYNV